MSERTENLAPREHWDGVWSAYRPERASFDYSAGAFGAVDKLLHDTLPFRPGLSFLEVGCYPGRFMWYFNRRFGYAVEGVEYIDWCCERTREFLAREGVDCRVENADFLSWEPGRSWDMVASFGFVEHFTDYPSVIARHASLVKPGGWLVLEVPNHRGLYGGIFRRLMPAVFAMHNRMGQDELADAMRQIPGMTVLLAAACGSFNLSHVGFLERTKQIGGVVHLAACAFKFSLESLFRLLPRSAYLAPYLVVVARKKEA